MRFLDTEAIPIGRRRLSGAGKLVTVLTPEHGRLSLVARGAELPRNRIGSALEPFGVARVILSPAGGSGLYRVEAADPRVRWGGLSADLSRMQAAGLVCAWARALSREEGSRSLFRLLRHALTSLDNPDTPVAQAVARFLWRLAWLAGVGPDWSGCVACHASPPFSAFRFSPGGGVCPRCRERRDVSLEPELSQCLRDWAGGVDGAGDCAERTARNLVMLAQRYLRHHFGEGLPCTIAGRNLA